MPAPVTLHAYSDGWGAVCGGCMHHSGSVRAATDEDAWRELEGLGWTVFRYDQWAHAYPKCPKCSGNPPGDVPKRKARRHR